MTLSRLERRLRGLEAQIGSTGAWRAAAWVVIPDWTFTAPDGTQVAVQEGQPWPVSGRALNDQPMRLSAELKVPADFAGRPLSLSLDVGGEALALPA